MSGEESEQVAEKRSDHSHPADPFWLTSQFSTKELNGGRLLVNWTWRGEMTGFGIYIMKAGAYGHSRHIQWIHAVPADGEDALMHAFDFDQTDADLLHRTNENPKEYSFVASLDPKRKRQQNHALEKLVDERRIRKKEDETGPPPFKFKRQRR